MGFPIFTTIGTGIGAFFGGPAGAAAGAVIGSGIDGSMGQDEANRANARIALDNRDWQTEMSNTAAQRAAADFKRAGFNPMLATGAQASTPQGSTATMQNTMEPIQTAARDVSSVAMQQQQLKKQDAEIDLLRSQKDAADAQALKTTVDASVSKKGIPEAELKNDVYDIIRPGVKRIKEMMQPNATKPFKLKVHP